MSVMKNIFLVIVVSIVTLKIADLSFGMIQPMESLSTSVNRATVRSIVLREFNPNQSAEVSPSNKLTTQADSLKQTPYPVKIDENGFIDNGNSDEANPKLRVIFLGGSTTENLFVQPENRFPSVVELSLRKALNQTVVTHNAGVAGNNSMHSYLSFIAKGIPLKPNYAVLMHNVNDLSLLSKTESYWVAPSMRTLVAGNSRSMFADKDLFRSFTFDFLKRLKNIIFPNLYAYLGPRLLPNKALSRDEFQELRGSLPVVNFNSAEKQFRSSLLSFTQLSRAWDIEPILMTQANRINTNDIVFKKLYETSPDIGMSPEQFELIYQKFNDIIREVALEQNVQLIDLDVLLRPSNKYLFDTVHLNDEGNIRAGEIITKHLLMILSKDSKIDLN
mgnify:FL=1